jgi:hypothetical protein
MRTATLTLLAATVAAVGLLASPAAAGDRVCRGAIGAVTIADNVRVPRGATCTLTRTYVKGNVQAQRARCVERGRQRQRQRPRSEGAAAAARRLGRHGRQRLGPSRRRLRELLGRQRLRLTGRLYRPRPSSSSSSRSALKIASEKVG